MTATNHSDAIDLAFYAIALDRLFTMEHTCKFLSTELGKRGQEKVGRRLLRASEAFKDINKEITEYVQQQRFAI